MDGGVTRVRFLVQGKEDKDCQGKRMMIKRRKMKRNKLRGKREKGTSQGAREEKGPKRSRSNQMGLDKSAMGDAAKTIYVVGRQT